MSANRQVAVFDPVMSDLRKIPLKRIKASDYEKVQIPKWQRRFDVYASNELDEDDTYIIITRAEDVSVEKSFLARLRYDHLGVKAGVQKILSSKYRTLYIGAIPEG